MSRYFENLHDRYDDALADLSYYRAKAASSKKIADDIRQLNSRLTYDNKELEANARIRRGDVALLRERVNQLEADNAKLAQRLGEAVTAQPTPFINYPVKRLGKIKPKAFPPKVGDRVDLRRKSDGAVRRIRIAAVSKMRDSTYLVSLQTGIRYNLNAYDISHVWAD